MKDQFLPPKIGKKLPKTPSGKERSWSSNKGIPFFQFLVAVLLLLNLLLFYGIFFSSHGIAGYRQKHLQVKESEERNDKVRAKNQQIFQRIKNAKTDTRAQERLIREQLGWVREGEVVIEFLPGNEPPRKDKPGDEFPGTRPKDAETP